MAKGAISPAFWSGKHVFLTGHTGFKGGWMAQILLGLGARVTGFALSPETSPALFDALDLQNRMTSVIGDIRDANDLSAAVNEAAPDIVIHMAAQPIVSEGYADPVGTFATNVMGTVHLLDALRVTGATLPVLVISSDKCYLNNDIPTAFDEDAALGGKDPYSASKACTEIAAHSYRQSFFDDASGIRLASARAGNVIGGGDWSVNRLVPDMMRAFASDAPALIRNPLATRPWQHVLEPLYGYLLAIEALSSGTPYPPSWNFGPAPDDVHPVQSVVDLAVQAWGANASIQYPERKQTWSEAKVLSVDPARAAALLGWSARLDLTHMTNWTVDWYRKYYDDPSQARGLTDQQIDDYFQLQSGGDT